MAKLTFVFWTMGAWKSLYLINQAFEYQRYKEPVISFNHKDDVRYAIGKIASKSGLSIPAESFDKDTNFCKLIETYIKENQDFNQNLKAILIDEAQFLSTKQVNQLVKINYLYNVDIICAWLKTNFVGLLFDGSKRLLEVASELIELSKRCWCGQKAIMNARIVNGEIIKKWNEKFIGGDEAYQTVCLYHYIENNIGKK